MQPIVCIAIVGLETGKPGLVQVTFDIFERRLQPVQEALQFLQITAGDDQVVGPQPVRGRQLAGHVSLLAASLLAVAPATAGTLLLGQLPAAPAAAGFGCSFRHVTNGTAPTPGAGGYGSILQIGSCRESAA